MEAKFLAKRALFNIPKFFPPGIQTTRKATRACLSSAFERAQGTNDVVEAEGSSETSDAPRDAVHEPKSKTFTTGEGMPPESSRRYAADTTKDGIKKAVEMAENVGDSAKKTLDGVWEAAKDTAQGIKERVSNENDDYDNEMVDIEEDGAVDEVRKVDQPVDTQEYRSIEEMKKLDEHA